MNIGQGLLLGWMKRSESNYTEKAWRMGTCTAEVDFVI